MTYRQLRDAIAKIREIEEGLRAAEIGMRWAHWPIQTREAREVDLRCRIQDLEDELDREIDDLYLEPTASR